eukprot:4315953-Karenia_brevis.AAC.1
MGRTRGQFGNTSGWTGNSWLGSPARCGLAKAVHRGSGNLLLIVVCLKTVGSHSVSEGRGPRHFQFPQSRLSSPARLAGCPGTD